MLKVQTNPELYKINVSRTIKSNRIMWKLLHHIRNARIRRDSKKLKHLEARYDRLEAAGLRALP